MGPKKVFAAILVLSSLVRSEEELDWQNPLPPLPDLHDLHFSGPRSGFAVGSGGTLLRTDDGGNTWTQAEVPTLGDLRAIHSTDPMTAYVAGSRGALLKTLDGGESWSTLSAGSKLDLACLAFTSKTRGFAGGDSGSLFKTEDAGRTWKPVPTGLSTPIRALQFVDERTAFALGDAVVLKSTDGGETWARTSISADPSNKWANESSYGMLFRDRLTGYYSSDETHWNIPSTPHYGSQRIRRLYRTSDGGETWTAMARYFQPLHFPASGGGFGNDGLVLLKSAGASETWADAGALAAAPNALRFADSTTGFAVGNQGTIQKTADGGLTWKILDGVFPRRESIDSLSTLGSVHFPSPDVGYAAGPEGIIRTRDAGAHWMRLPLNRRIHKVFFTTPLTGFALGTESEGADSKGTLLRTIDGGETWEDHSALASRLLLDVRVFPDGRGVAVGKGGLVLETDDGGANWKKGWSGTDMDLKVLAFRDGKTGFMGGGGHDGDVGEGALFETRDGGKTWTRVAVADPKYHNPEGGPAEPNDIVMSIEFPGPASVVIATRGQTWKSKDGGRTWSILGLLPDFVETIHFRDEDTAYAQGFGFYKSVDGGATWNEFSRDAGYRTFAMRHFRSMCFSDPATAYAVGDEGIIARMRIVEESATRVGGAPALARPGEFRAGLAPGNMLWYELPAASRARAHIWDLRGRKRADLFDRTSGAGRHHFRIPAGICGKGGCVLELRAGNLRRALRLPGD